MFGPFGFLDMTMSATARVLRPGGIVFTDYKHMADAWWRTTRAKRRHPYGPEAGPAHPPTCDHVQPPLILNAFARPGSPVRAGEVVVVDDVARIGAAPAWPRSTAGRRSYATSRQGCPGRRRTRHRRFMWVASPCAFAVGVTVWVTVTVGAGAGVPYTVTVTVGAGFGALPPHAVSANASTNASTASLMFILLRCCER